MTDVRPLAPEETTDGTMGEWRAFHPGPDQATWVYGIEETPGVLWVDEQLASGELTALFAHELGHACSVQADKDATGGAIDELNAELTADRYAYKWGFGRAIAIQRRTRKRSHHGYAPGQVFEEQTPSREWFRYRVTRKLRIRCLGPVKAKRSVKK